MPAEGTGALQGEWLARRKVARDPSEAAPDQTGAPVQEALEWLVRVRHGRPPGAWPGRSCSAPLPFSLPPRRPPAWLQVPPLSQGCGAGPGGLRCPEPRWSHPAPRLPESGRGQGLTHSPLPGTQGAGLHPYPQRKEQKDGSAATGHGAGWRAPTRTPGALSQTPAAFWGIWPPSRLPVEGGCSCLALLWGPPFPGLLWGPAGGSCWLLKLERPLRPHDAALAGPPMGQLGMDSAPPRPPPLGARRLRQGLGREPPPRVSVQGLAGSAESLPWTVCGSDDDAIIHSMSPEHLPGLSRPPCASTGAAGAAEPPGGTSGPQEAAGLVPAAAWGRDSDLRPQAAQPHSSDEPGRRTHTPPLAGTGHSARVGSSSGGRPCSGPREASGLKVTCTEHPAREGCILRGTQVPCTPAAGLVKSQKGQKPQELAVCPPVVPQAVSNRRF